MPIGKIKDKSECQACGLENTCYCIDCDNVEWIECCKSCKHYYDIVDYCEFEGTNSIAFIEWDEEGKVIACSEWEPKEDEIR